jgi:LPS-assembly protein
MAGTGVRLHAQQVTQREPVAEAASQQLGQGRSSAQDQLPQDPSADRFPSAVPVPDANAQTVVIESENRQTRSGSGKMVLDGGVSIRYGTYRIQADHIEYDEDTGDVEASGHLHVQGDGGSENINASHASLNIKTENGTFYDVAGSVGLKQTAKENVDVPGSSGLKQTTKTSVYTTNNPFLFTGRMVVKNGPQHFEIYDGTVTSCQLPRPDWQLVAGKFLVVDGKARAYRTTFKLFRVPLLFLPYVTHPTAPDERQSGILIPIIGQSSTKGLVLGEQIYFALSRNSELTVGAQYYSKRGWEQAANFRMRGLARNFLNARYSGLLDRGLVQTTTSPTGVTTTTVTNQGGEDFAFSGRKDLGTHSRVAADVEYLSSYIYREAFTESFNQAVSSDIVSYAYGTHAQNGYVASAEADRYQGLKIVSTGEQIRIIHAPLFQVESLERRVGTTPILWSATAQYAALKRTQGTPLAQTGFASNVVSRVDVHPRLSLPFALGGFHFRPSVGVRDTYYAESRVASPLPGPPPTERDTSLNRLVTEAEFELRTPVLERTFATSGLMTRLFGTEVKHTIEPELHYRYASGVDSFMQTLRFDDTDVVSNRNELEYGVTQRLFMRPSKTRPCETGELPVETGASCGGTRETMRWRVFARTYFDSSFGGVIINGRRNVLDSTLDLSGVAFLTDQRSVSPIVSELKVNATDHIDLEWDMNYDTHAGKFTQSNTFLNFHGGGLFGGVSHARLNAPGRFATSTGGTTTLTSLTSDFSQLRFLFGYGTPSKPGLSIATNMGLDLSAVQPQSTASHLVRAVQPQYAAAQVSYNWNCCGFSAEYRKYELGSVRNENAYRFNFTLANIGTAGTLRKAESLF